MQQGYEQTRWWAEFQAGTILSGYRGSQAHGTYRPNSDPDSTDDIDVMSVVVQPAEAYLGFGRQETYERFEDPWDVVVYDARHFVRLLCKQNPNVLSLLWLRPEDYLVVTDLGRRLVNTRGAFVSKQAYQSFVGYARSQMHKMENGACLGYMGEKRRALVLKHGYDCKNASHLIRLLRMCVEFLETGQLNVLRRDADELVDIKRGRYALTDIKDEAARLFALADAALAKSSLQEKVDEALAEQLLVGMLRGHLDRAGALT